MSISCLYCNKKLAGWQKKYCSNKCQSDYQHRKYIQLWKKGEVDGNRGVETKNISRHLKRYLIEKCGEKCSLCGWNKKHPVSSSCPLEIDHIDGSFENNSEENLRLLCPNCHALTPNYKKLNNGKGREWRRLKYRKVLK